MALFTDPNLLAYNGYTFDAKYTSKMEVKPVKDDSGRMVKWYEYKLTVKAYIDAAGATSTDTTLATLRKQLMMPGGILYYNCGFGNIGVNNPLTGVYDVNWGPKPEMLSFVPIGTDQAALIEWSVTFCLPECYLGAERYRNSLMSLNYEVTASYDSDMYETRTTTGSIEIPITFAAARSRTPDHADAYRELIWFEPSSGFVRKSQTFKLSMDRRRLEFTFVDEEMPTRAPRGVSKCEIKHRTKSAMFGGGGPGSPGGFAIAENEISGTIRVNHRRTDRRFAVAVFLGFALERIVDARRTPRMPPRPLLAGLPGLGWLAPRPTFPNVIITEFEAEEDVFGRDNRFRLTYKIIGSTLGDMLAISRLWANVTGAVTWRTEVATPRGMTSAEFDPRAHDLLDLCGSLTIVPRPSVVEPPVEPTPVTTLVGVPAPTPPPAPGVRAVGAVAGSLVEPRSPLMGSPIRAVPVPAAPAAGGVAFFGGSLRVSDAADEDINPETSWISYNTTLVYDQDNHVVVHRPLTGQTRTNQPAFDPTRDIRQTAGTTTVSGPNVIGQQHSDLVQNTTPPSMTFTLVGSASRLGYRVPVPEITRIAGEAVTEISRSVSEAVIALAGRVPIMGLAWSIRYAVATPPKLIPVLANPIHGGPK